MSPKDQFVKLLNDLFDHLGVDHLLGTILLCFLLSLLTVKDIKDHLHLLHFIPFEKEFIHLLFDFNSFEFVQKDEFETWIRITRLRRTETDYLLARISAHHGNLGTLQTSSFVKKKIRNIWLKFIGDEDTSE